MNISGAFNLPRLGRAMGPQNSSSDMRVGLLGRIFPTRSARAKVRLPVIMAVRPDFKIKAVIEDLSKDGVRLRSRVVLHEGQVVRLKMPRETIACEIRWVNGFEAGGVLTDKSTLPDWRSC